MLSLVQGSGWWVMPYLCEICKRVFESKQGLRGHLRVHKGMLARVVVAIPKDRAELFKSICRKHGITTCHAILGFIDALEAADKEGHKILIAANPLVINISQTFLGKPRSAWKVPVPPATYIWPPSCVYADAFLRSTREVGCTSQKDWVALAECWRCFQRGGRQL